MSRRLGLLLATVLAAAAMAAEPRSGYQFMGPALRAMQDDDAANPGMLWVLDGEAAWRRREGAADRSCADCHGDAASSMRGVAARHPAMVEGRPLDLAQRINRCRSERQQAPPLPPESDDLLALTAFVARQSRGLPVAPAEDAATLGVVEAGRVLFHQRQGQIDLSCAICHDAHWDRLLAGAPVTPAHPVGYPLYRLEWQTLGSLQRRLRSCLTGMRAEAWPYDAPELVALELYLMWRARGLLLEAPAVRP